MNKTSTKKTPILAGTAVYYPLNTGNTWTYKMKDGTTYTNSIIGVDLVNHCEFTVANSFASTLVKIRKEENFYLTTSYEAEKFLLFLKDDMINGQNWSVIFDANGFENILIVTVKQTGLTKEVEGLTYEDVVQLEAESRMNMNGQMVALNFFTQYYYAKGVGLILTTSSMGDEHALISCELK
jgi:hypothetical protein